MARLRYYMVAVFLFALVLANVWFSACNVVKGKVSCLDCGHHKSIDLSDIKVVVKCNKVKKISSTTTNGDGSFETELPSSPSLLPSSNCLVKVLGGPNQLYATRATMVSTIVEAKNGSGHSYFTTSTQLAVSTSCPKEKAPVKCAKIAEVGDSKTVDLPVPGGLGLASTSYYVPFIPIIGIP